MNPLSSGTEFLQKARMASYPRCTFSKMTDRHNRLNISFMLETHVKPSTKEDDFGGIYLSGIILMENYTQLIRCILGAFDSKRIMIIVPLSYFIPRDKTLIRDKPIGFGDKPYANTHLGFCLSVPIAILIEDRYLF